MKIFFWIYNKVKKYFSDVLLENIEIGEMRNK